MHSQRSLRYNSYRGISFWNLTGKEVEGGLLSILLVSLWAVHLSSGGVSSWRIHSASLPDAILLLGLFIHSLSAFFLYGGDTFYVVPWFWWAVALHSILSSFSIWFIYIPLCTVFIILGGWSLPQVQSVSETLGELSMIVGWTSGQQQDPAKQLLKEQPSKAWGGHNITDFVWFSGSGTLGCLDCRLCLGGSFQTNVLLGWWTPSWPDGDLVWPMTYHIKACDLLFTLIHCPGGWPCLTRLEVILHLPWWP